jgi:hypothetical protein
MEECLIVLKEILKKCHGWSIVFQPTCPTNQVAIPKKRAQFGAANQSKALAKFHSTLYRAIQTHVDFKQVMGGINIVFRVLSVTC